jgi:hypothetical protein
LVFKFFFVVWFEGVGIILAQNLLMQQKSLFNVCDLVEMYGVWNSQALHAISMTPLLEMLLKCFLAPVAGASADLTFVLLTQTMQLVEPKRNRLPIPTNW